jgi:hypothetical protein
MLHLDDCSRGRKAARGGEAQVRSAQKIVLLNGQEQDPFSRSSGPTPQFNDKPDERRKKYDLN